MKIAFIAGAWSVHTVKFVNELVKFGHDVTLFSLKAHEDKNKKVSQIVKIIYLEGKPPLAYYLVSRNLKKLLAKGNFDIVNAHYASGYGTLARLSKARPLTLNVWGSDVYDFPHESRFKYRTLLKNLLYANSIASTSNSMAEETKSLLNSYDKEIFITPFGVDLDKFQLKRPTRETKGEINIGIIKKLSKKYGIDYLIHSFEILVQKYENKRKIKLKIYGEGEDENLLKKLVCQLGLNSHIEFKGYIDNDKVPEVLQSLDIFVQSSILDSESFGVAVVEAMAVGLPVVVTDVSGAMEVVKNKETGLIVPRKDPKAMAEAISILIEDKELREKFGSQGRKTVEESYSLDKNVKTLIKVYEKTIDEVNNV